MALSSLNPLANCSEPQRQRFSIAVLGADRGGIPRLMIKSRDNKYHQVTAAAVQLRQGR